LKKRAKAHRTTHSRNFRICTVVLETFQYVYPCVTITHYVFQAQKAGSYNLMTVKLFILGLPGSGKSTVARYVAKYVGDWDWPTAHLGDYPFLQEMFRNDIEGKQFKPADGGGFDVLDLTVFDTALERLEQRIRQSSSRKPEEINLIEFARSDYQRAFRQFSKKFLQDQDTYFLYLAAELEICKGRIQNRTANPISEDDYPVSKYIFEQYYHQDDGQHLPDILQKEYQIDQQQVRIVNNNNSLEEASTEINAFINFIIERTLFGTDTTDTLKGATLSSRIREERS
jgi:adenylate kinase family enzyme